MEDDTTGSEVSEEEFADIENTDTEEEAADQSYHYAARVPDFRTVSRGGC